MANQLDMQAYQAQLAQVETEIRRTMVGLEDLTGDALTALLSGGHVLFEGVPGLGKTLFVHTLAQVFSLKFCRIQFTPDLMPADITGTNILLEDQKGGRVFQFQPGPLFAQIVLADEINRATSKTQSALLEAMQEKSITVAGRTHQLEAPFFVLATQNPLEMEGTYPLPEAQVDRFFFKLRVPFPNREELCTIVARTTTLVSDPPQPAMDGTQLLAMQQFVRQLPVAEPLIDYAARIVLATHPDNSKAGKAVKEYVRYGASPRGAQTLVLAAKARAFMAGRASVRFEDIRQAAKPALRHRLILNFQGEAEDRDTDQLIEEILRATPEKER